MPKKAKPKPDDEEQSRRFLEVARELGADESGKKFRKSVAAIMKKKKSKEK